jgi:hypothetical protein
MLPPVRIALYALAAGACAACGGSDWQRPRSAHDPSDPGAPEARPRPAPTTLDRELPPPDDMPGGGHEHHQHHGAAPAKEAP